MPRPARIPHSTAVNLVSFLQIFPSTANIEDSFLPLSAAPLTLRSIDDRLNCRGPPKLTQLLQRVGLGFWSDQAVTSNRHTEPGKLTQRKRPDPCVFLTEGRRRRAGRCSECRQSGDVGRGEGRGGGLLAAESTLVIRSTRVFADFEPKLTVN